MNPTVLAQVKFGIREVSAFVGHSFSDDDRDVIATIKGVLSKLGMVCESGERPEPSSVSNKVRTRLESCEVFVGIFTRRESLSTGRYTTSQWVIDEKGMAITLGKRLLLFVEEGVDEIGGLQGDYEYIRFDRADMAIAVVKAIDYVLALTRVPFECRVDPLTKTIQLNLGAVSEVLPKNWARH